MRLLCLRHFLCNVFSEGPFSEWNFANLVVRLGPWPICSSRHSFLFLHLSTKAPATNRLFSLENNEGTSCSATSMWHWGGTIIFLLKLLEAKFLKGWHMCWSCCLSGGNQNSDQNRVSQKPHPRKLRESSAKG